jgi:hypothetical protein
MLSVSPTTGLYKSHFAVECATPAPNKAFQSLCLGNPHQTWGLVDDNLCKHCPVIFAMTEAAFCVACNFTGLV